MSEVTRDELLAIVREFSGRMADACDGTRAGKDHVKVRVADWHALMRLGHRADKATACPTPEKG